MTHQEYFDKLTDSIDTLSDILDTEHYGMCLVDKDGYIIKWYYEKFFNIKASAAVDATSRKSLRTRGFTLWHRPVSRS